MSLIKPGILIRYKIKKSNWDTLKLVYLDLLNHISVKQNRSFENFVIQFFAFLQFIQLHTKQNYINIK